MKNLLVLILIMSCGRNIEPPVQDLSDDDGDQILNKDELGFNKFIADLPNVQKLNGSIKIIHEGRIIL